MRPERPDEHLFDDLEARSGRDLISIFIPTLQKGRDVAQGRIRLKNQLSGLDETLAELGYKPREREDRLGAARELLDDHEFWEHQDAGLAVFVAEDGKTTPVSSADSFAPWSVVMPVFMLRPLIADMHALSAPVLALTKDAVALFATSGLDVEVLDVELPSYADVNWFVDREPQGQQHPHRVGSEGNRHGHEPSSRADEDIARFLREVNSSLQRFAANTPLIVLGDDDLVSRFAHHAEREIVSPPNSGITAPFDIDDVRRMVRTPLGRLREERVGAARSEAIDHLGLGQGTTDIEEALTAVISGRVGSVVIARDAAPIWGRLDLTTYEVETHGDHQPGDVDLLDRLVVWARDKGASVTATETSIDGRPFIAGYRY